MTTLTTLESAVHGLRQVLLEAHVEAHVDAHVEAHVGAHVGAHGGDGDPTWRGALRQQLSLVREALAHDTAPSSDGWLAARVSVHERERRHLLARVTALAARALERLEQEAADARRLLADLEHYQQRTHDLAYDAVALELGGSE